MGNGQTENPMSTANIFGAWKSAQRTQKVANILEFPLIGIQNGYADLMKSSGLEKTANGPSQPIG